MVYCENCGDPLAYQTNFCQKCGAPTNSAPRAVPGKQGLDPKRFVQGLSEPTGTLAPAQQQSSGSSGQATSPRAPGQVNQGIVGNYEYIKPGSFEKSRQTLELRSNGTCSYTEVGETSMEKFTTAGEGNWDCSEGVLRVTIAALTKDTTFKSKPIVPGIKEGRTVEYNISIPITESELLNATANGTNKWRTYKK